MKTTFAIFALAAVGAAAQQSSSSASSSSAAPATTPAPSSASSSASGPVCTALVGDPKAGCTYSATTVPPYNAESLQSWQIAAYTPGKEGSFFSDVAADMAKTVTEYYPSLAGSYSAIQSQYASALQVSATNYNRNAGGASFQLPGAITTSFALAALAVVAGGAFVL